jgi:hypothetical protein
MPRPPPDLDRDTSTSSCARMSSTSTHTDLTVPWISGRPSPTPRHVPRRPPACSDETGSAVLFTNTCRPREVTRFSAPTGVGLLAATRSTSPRSPTERRAREQCVGPRGLGLLPEPAEAGNGADGVN